MPKPVWKTWEVAEASREAARPVTQEHIRQLCKRGVVLATKPSRDWLILDEATRARLEEWLGGESPEHEDS